jgi:cytochrome c oxidase subunit 1
MLDERLGKLHFWVTTIAFNAVFLPLFAVGMGGHMRRIYNPLQYEFLKPMQPMHQFVTVAAIVLMLAQLVLAVNILWSLRAGRRASDNPWRANTLEWATTSPPPHGNFTRPLRVHRDPYEYSRPGAADDFVPQDVADAPRAA